MGTNRFGAKSTVSAFEGDQDRATMGLGQMLAKLRHFWCGLHGHEPLLQFDHDRIFLQCASCGFESSGWNVGEARARRLPRRHAPRYATRQLVDVRKVA